MAFRFRHFTVEDDKSTLKVGTDAMLLGAWADPGDAEKILDIGTGCGVIALMMAQKSNALTDAIDIDQPSVEQAQENFSKSPWAGRLNAIYGSLADFQPSPVDRYDFIISNPPWFSDQLKSVSGKVNKTKHEEGIGAGILVKNIHSLLKPTGRFSVIFPYENRLFFMNVCKSYGFHLSKLVIVHPRQGHRARRTLMEFSLSVCEYPVITQLSILNEDEKFTGEYLTLTADFHRF